MRIEGLRLSWFRGAGPEVSLEPKGKSLACFGPNGAGKSTFVDALEYLAGDGKIDHLSHEYAGKSQINAVRNTHAPAASPATIEVTFPRGATLAASITAKGAVKIVPSEEAAATALASWRSAQLILRQDEVARFIHATKGEKYSALLPLLGLGEIETVVDNLHRLAREVAKQGQVAELDGEDRGIRRRRWTRRRAGNARAPGAEVRCDPDRRRGSRRRDRRRDSAPPRLARRRLAPSPAPRTGPGSGLD